MKISSVGAFALLPFASAGCKLQHYKCYVDDHSRILNTLRYSEGPISLEYCAQFCSDHHLKLAGVENGSECYCGDKLRSDAKAATAGECNIKCSADSGEQCGGSWRIGVFNFTCSGDPVPKPKVPPYLNNPCLNKTTARSKQPWCDPALPIDVRVADMVSRLTIDEKITALDTSETPIASLGLNAYNWWSEATHGISHVRNDDKTPYESNFAFPITTAMSFNRSLWWATGQLIGREARAFMNAGNAWSTFWAPVINLAREPRWGRNIETPGEDPYLTAEYSVSFVKGFQVSDDDRTHLQASACCKHFVANSMENSEVAGQSFTRHNFNANISTQDLVDSYLLPFQACVERGQVSSLMCSYNAVNGVPSCANDWLLKTVARDAWGFDGYITSDCGAENDVFANHHFTQTPEEAVRDVLRAGTDIDCTSFMGKHAKSALSKGLISESEIDVRLANLFKVRMRLGHFDPLGPLDKIPTTEICTAGAKATARDGAAQGATLLKNEAAALPLKASATGKIAVLGPTANLSRAIANYYGGNSCDNDFANLIDSIAEAVPSARTTTAAGVTIGAGCKSDDTSGVAAAAALARAADAVVLALGTDLHCAREGQDADSIAFNAGQLALLTAVTNASSKPIVVVIFTAVPLDITPLLANPMVGAVLHVGQPSVQTRGVADVLFGLKSPGGRAIQTIYPAAYADQISIFDFNMRPGPSEWPRPDCKGPAASCPRGVNPGRTYRFYTGKPVVEFGYGMSYTTFKYSLRSEPTAALSLTPLTVLLEASKAATGGVVGLPKLARTAQSDIKYSVTVTNTGSVDSDDAVLGYLHPPGAGTGGRPLKSLFGFERVHVKAGESVTVWLYPSLTDFAFTGPTGERNALAGEYRVSFGVQGVGMGFVETKLQTVQ